MLILKLALRNLRRHLRKTLLLGTLIAVGIAALFMANAVFQGTNEGLEASFVGSLTGHAVVSAKAETEYSLFGNEVPIISEYENIPPIPSFKDLAVALDGLESAAAWAPVVSSPAQIRAGGYTGNSIAFGVDPDSYFSVLPDIVIERGDPEDLRRGGVFINPTMLAAMESISKRTFNLGEPIALGMQSRGTFSLKKGFFAGVHSYVGPTEALERVVLADPTLVRSLANYTLGYIRVGDPGEPEAAVDSFDLDSLFSDAEDTESDPSQGLTPDYVVAAMSDTSLRDALVKTDAEAWSFALVRAREGYERRLEAGIRASLDETGLECRAMGWRAAAGMSAQALLAVQAAFYAGLVVVALGAILVIMNALVISVLERSAEIGTMRGLGAGASFIRRLFIAESMILTVTSAAIGLAVGLAASAWLSRRGVTLSNPLLITLFGGDVVRPSVSMASAAWHLALASAVGALAWVYPVSLAMRIQPVTAMGAS